MIRAGLTGGYATGKSFVASELARLGCMVAHADQLGHAVLEPDAEAYAPVVELFGKDVLNEDRRIDRKKLGGIVFGARELLRELEAIVHPAVFRREQEIADKFAKEQPHGIFVYEAAILIETGHYKQYDRMIVTSAPTDEQLRRGMARDGLTPDQVTARIARQLPDEQKRAYADFVIYTGGTKAETARQVREVFMALKELAQRGLPTE